MSSQRIDVRLTAEQYEGDSARVLRWLRRVGDVLVRNEPLVEIETEKVTVEIPAPADGRLAEILRAENEATWTDDVLARIERTVDAHGFDEAADRVVRPVAGVDDAVASDAAGVATAGDAGWSGSPADETCGSAEAGSPVSNAERRLSPAVRRLLAARHLDASQVSGTGRAGRITAEDVLRHAADARPSRLVPHTPMRRRIAQNLSMSVSTAPHVTAMFEADLSAVLAHRQATQAAFASRGVNLTLTAYFVAACVPALRAVPSVNSRFHEDSLEIFDDFNIGVGTALGDQGLVVPVVREAQNLDLFAIAAELTRLTEDARDGTLAAKSMQGGTFTISNHGVSGSLIAAPIIINQPQCAILGVGKLERRPSVVVIDGVESVRILPKCYVSLTIDHRAIDGFQANHFLRVFVKRLETFPGD